MSSDCDATSDYQMSIGKITAVMPKCVGALSLVCSGFVINHICRTPGQLSKVTNRLLLGLSCADVIYTFVLPCMTSWMVPPDLRDSCGQDVYVYMNTGNMHTCTMQGFLDQFSSKCSWTYNAVLAFSYFVAVRFRSGEKMLVRYEKLLHGVPIVLGLLAAIIPLPYQAYNHAGGAWCWLAVSPQGCDKKNKTCVGCEDQGREPCERGENYDVLRLWLAFIPLFATQIVVLFSMLGLFLTVFSIHNKTARYGAPAAADCSAARRKATRRNLAWKRSKKVALKCVLYVLAFEVTWFFNIVGVIRFIIDPTNDHEIKGPTAGGWITTQYMLNLAFLSSYGIWSSIAYFLLPFLKVRKEQPEWSFLKKVKRTVLPPSRIGCPMGVKAPRLRIPWLGDRMSDGSEGEGGSTSNVAVGPQKTYFEEEDDFGHVDDEDSDDDDISRNDAAGGDREEIESQ